MKRDLIPAFMSILGEMFPRSVYCLVFQLGDNDNSAESDLNKTETTNILPAMSAMYQAVEESGLDVKKHFEKASPEISKILNKALAEAFAEKLEKMADEEEEEE